MRAAEGSPDPWARASAAEDLGVLLIGRRDFEEAGRRLEDSLAGYDQTAALRDGRRVRRRLRGIGIRRRHFTHAKRPKTGWTSLTDTERAVSDLVAKGLTNQQIATEMFLSTHTVAFHLRQVFRKLDIGSRVDLARVFTEQARLASEGMGSLGKHAAGTRAIWERPGLVSGAALRGAGAGLRDDSPRCWPPGPAGSTRTRRPGDAYPRWASSRWRFRRLSGAAAGCGRAGCSGGSPTWMVTQSAERSVRDAVQ